MTAEGWSIPSGEIPRNQLKRRGGIYRDGLRNDFGLRMPTVSSRLARARNRSADPDESDREKHVCGHREINRIPQSSKTYLSI